MPSAISLLIVHSKELIRAGLRAMLANSGIKPVGEATDASSALTLAKKHKPDVVLLDAAIPGGDAFQLVKKIGTSVPATKFIVISVLENPTYIARAKAAGASNLLLMSVSQKELITAIQNAAAGKSAMEAEPCRKILAPMNAEPNAELIRARVTPRETQVLRHLAYGLSNEEIAMSLELSVSTVSDHVKTLLSKLRVADRTNAAVWAVRAGLV
jgi:DNA-binding NarL/FixJ family response regulator